MRRFGRWLAILAITLNAAWPLLANARPKSVHLVPLCTVEGITHYLEVPGGSSPLDKSADSHHDHCAFCFLGAGGPLLSSHAELRLPVAVATERVASGAECSPISTALIVHGARAPPLSSVVTDHNNFRGQDETSLFAGSAARAPYS